MSTKPTPARATLSMADLAAKLGYSLPHYRKIFYSQRPTPDWLVDLPRPRRCGKANLWLAEAVDDFLRQYFSLASEQNLTRALPISLYTTTPHVTTAK